MTSSEALTFINDFADFIEASPSSYHAVETMAAMLTAGGFVELDEATPWTNGADDVMGARFVRREGALIAWRTPQRVDPQRSAFRVVGSHTDSPGFKLKPAPTITDGRCQVVGVEIYGGPLLNSWLDRELRLAGRLTTKDGAVHLVETPAVMKIPQLAPHLDRSQNDSLTLDKQHNLMPLLGYDHPEFDLIDYLAECASVSGDEVAFYDVITVPAEKPAVFGLANDLFAAKRMDNLTSVFPSVRALVDANDPSDICVMACFDHEEVGSSTRSGACGPFLEDILVRIAEGLGVTGGDYRAMIARSLCVSADAGHAVNPNHRGKYDPTNQPVLNGGPLVKVNSQQRYATDALGTARWLRACELAQTPVQFFVSNNSVPCGTTIGPLTATRIGLTTVDIGIGLLAMHSARETCGVADPLYLKRAIEALWTQDC